MTKDQIDEILGNTRDAFAELRAEWAAEDAALERAAGTPNTGNCPEVSMPTHRDADTAC